MSRGQATGQQIPMRYCTNCRYRKRELCLHEESGFQDPVAGTVVYMTCSIMRHQMKECGKTAKLYEPRESLYARLRRFLNKLMATQGGE